MNIVHLFRAVKSMPKLLVMESTAPEAGTEPRAADAPRRRGRPSTPLLSRSKLTPGALAVLARAGYDGLTMAGLARELKTAPSALYNHVKSKDEVLNWVQDDVNDTIDTSGFAHDPWDLALAR